MYIHTNQVVEYRIQYVTFDILSNNEQQPNQMQPVKQPLSSGETLLALAVALKPSEV